MCSLEKQSYSRPKPDQEELGPVEVSAQTLFCLGALFDAMRVHSYTRMTYLIMMWLSDLCKQREVGTFGGIPWGTTVLQDENLPTCKPAGIIKSA